MRRAWAPSHIRGILPHVHTHTFVGGVRSCLTLQHPTYLALTRPLLPRGRAGFEALEQKCNSDASLSYSDVMEAMEQVEAPIEYAWGVVGHLMGVANSDELRQAHSEMQPKVVQVTTKLGQSVPVFNAVEKIASSDELDETQRRIIDQSLMGMKLSGVGLTGEAKEKFNANRLSLAEASTAFSNNLLDATKAFKLTLTDKADVEGLPPSALALAAERAAADGHEGATAQSGPWQLGLDIPSYLPSMKFVKVTSQCRHRCSSSRRARRSRAHARKALVCCAP